MKYEIFVTENGVERTTHKIVRSVNRAEELCAIYNDLDAGTGRTYSYKKIN